MRKHTANKHTIRKLLRYAARYRLLLGIILLCAAASSASALAAPMILGRAVDTMLGRGAVDFAVIGQLTLVLAGLYIVGIAASRAIASLSVTVSTRTVQDMRHDAFAKLTKLPVSFFDKMSGGSLLSRFSNDMDAISEGLLQTVTQLFSGGLTLVGAVGLMLAIDFGIAMAVVIVAPLALLIAGFIAKRSGRMFRRQQETLGAYNGFMDEAINGQHIVQAFGLEQPMAAAASAINTQLYDCGQKAQFYSSLVNPSTRFVNNTAYVLVGVIGGLSAAAGMLSVGAISSLLLYSAQFAKPLNEVTAIAAQLQAALAAAERFFALLDEPEEPSDTHQPALAVSRGAVRFEDVSFSYTADSKLIHGLNLDIPAGSMVAIVGSTGAGKTTLVNLLMRFFDVSGGRITIDGQDIAQMQRDSVRMAFGMVLQDTWLANGTVRENIAFGRSNATEPEIIEAAHAARCHEFIKRLENGYNTILTDSGQSLSQGERQLLTIARAMLANAPMLILDEATSNVDPRTELQIQDALARLMQGKTSFVIAHRLSTIRHADIIVVMDKGQVVETGTYAELMAHGQFYKQLHEAQWEGSK